MTDPSRREVVEAGYRADPATARRGLAAADPSVRASAFSALDRLGALGDADLTAGATDPAPEVRRVVAELASRHRAVVLDPLLADGDSTVVEMAAWAAGEREQVDEAVLERLIEMAGSHRDALVRESAVAALGAIGDERALPAILSALADKPAIRRRAVIALSPFDGTEVEAAWIRAATDRDWQVRQLVTELRPDLTRPE